MKHALIAEATLALLALSMIVGMAGCILDSASETDLLFLVQKPAEGERVVLQALYQGSVIESEGCLRLGDETIVPERHTVVWPPGFRLVSRAGVRLVLDEAGNTIGQVGRSSFHLGGGEVPTLWEDGPVDEATRTAALNRCPGRYWLVGEVMIP